MLICAFLMFDTRVFFNSYPECRIYASVVRVGIGSDNGLSPIRYTKALSKSLLGYYQLGPKEQNFSFTKMHLKRRQLNGDHFAQGRWVKCLKWTNFNYCIVYRQGKTHHNTQIDPRGSFRLRGIHMRAANAQATYLKNEYGYYNFKTTDTFPKGQWVNSSPGLQSFVVQHEDNPRCLVDVSGSIHIHFRLRCCPCPILWGWQMTDVFTLYAILLFGICLSTEQIQCHAWCGAYIHEMERGSQLFCGKQF